MFSYIKTFLKLIESQILISNNINERKVEFLAKNSLQINFFTFRRYMKIPPEKIPLLNLRFVIYIFVILLFTQIIRVSISYLILI